MDVSVVMDLLFDRRKLGAVLWSCVASQAREQETTEADFLNTLDGDALTAGWGALVDAIVFFTPSQSRGAMQAAIEAQVEALEKGVEALVEVAQSEQTSESLKIVSQKMRDEMQAGMSKALGEFAGNLAAS